MISFLEDSLEDSVRGSVSRADRPSWRARQILGQESQVLLNHALARCSRIQMGSREKMGGVLPDCGK